MKRTLKFKNTMINKENKDFICGLLPELKNTFSNTECFSHYYTPDSCEIELDIDKIEKLNSKFFITLYSTHIIVEEII